MVEYEAQTVACGPTFTCIIGCLKDESAEVLSEEKANLIPFEPIRK